MTTAYHVGVGDRFWSLTMWELSCAVAAHRKSSEAQWRMAAWVSANVMNMWSKKRITVQKLLRGMGGPQRFASKAEARAEMARRRQRELEGEG